MVSFKVVNGLILDHMYINFVLTQWLFWYIIMGIFMTLIGLAINQVTKVIAVYSKYYILITLTAVVSISLWYLLK